MSNPATLQIPFNRPYATGKELWYISKAIGSGHLSGDGYYTKAAQNLLRDRVKARKVLLTTSGTAALEMAAILADIQPGDEVIMPSYTFVSTANAFVLQGAKPVFVDVRPDSLNLNEQLIEGAITERTKAICVVHYAGAACEMQTIMKIARAHNLLVIEDAAQAVGSVYYGRPLGTLGHLGCYSFHETKNIQCGEGGALVINDDRFDQRAEIIREKGTNRTQFFRGEVDKYTWFDKGSSFLPSDLTAAFLYAQLECLESITQQRHWIWRQYDSLLRELSGNGKLFQTTDAPINHHNSHMYYLVLDSKATRDAFIAHMKERGVMCVAHYVPLHSSPYGSKVGRAVGDFTYTDMASERLVRLPLWLGIEPHLHRVFDGIYSFFRRQG